MKTALIVIGASGANGSALMRQLAVYSAAPGAERYGMTGLPIFDSSALGRAADFAVAGWDLRLPDRESGLSEGNVTLGLGASPNDTLLGDELAGRSWSELDEAAAVVSNEIEDFVEASGSRYAIVLNVASPIRARSWDARPLALPTTARNSATYSSAHAYLLGSVRAGAHYIDFTPSAILEAPDLPALARSHNTQYAGRDGSTGQTYLKLTIAGALASRGLEVTNWYSTNVLGNRDGKVLEIPGVGETKMQDKAFGLNSIAGLTAKQHRIDIRHMPELGDKKEAWDSVLFRDSFGNEGELQLRWKAFDTPLAVQLILDLVRIFSGSVAFHEPGLRADLGFFFKRPLGARVRTPEYMFTHLIEANSQLLVGGSSRETLDW